MSAAGETEPAPPDPVRSASRFSEGDLCLGVRLPLGNDSPTPVRIRDYRERPIAQASSGIFMINTAEAKMRPPVAMRAMRTPSELSQ